MRRMARTKPERAVPAAPLREEPRAMTIKLRTVANDLTKYSDLIAGAEQNFEWPARFDLTGSTLGISQTHGDGTIERVLLSRAQVEALVEFVTR